MAVKAYVNLTGVAQLAHRFGDNTAYFIDQVAAQRHEDFIPRDEDILSMCAPTTDIVESKFELKKRAFHVRHVGGQRDQRNKWIQRFSNAPAVLFVLDS